MLLGLPRFSPVFHSHVLRKQKQGRPGNEATVTIETGWLIGAYAYYAVVFAYYQYVLISGSIQPYIGFPYN